MKARVRAAAGRLALGTGLLLHGLGNWLAPGGWGLLLVRGGGSLVGLAFVGRLFARAPQLVYAVPLVWVAAAWWMSDSSATPPPLPLGPDSDEHAGETGEVDRVEWGPEGVTCTIHPVRGQVNEP
ncbi:hypothetical protein [Streptomyces sp. NPDC005407]|uniref:hypothetical protein n=1 Tax=Streptomyces sp. NPDC005407 TaxID=3155340 RepID=UPI0033B12FDE